MANIGRSGEISIARLMLSGAEGLRRSLRHADAGKNLIMLLLTIVTLYPLYAQVIMSGKDISEFNHDHFGLALPFYWENYLSAWAEVQGYIFNSMVANTASCIAVLILSCLGGFAFARYTFPGKTFLWYAMLSLMMVPGILTLIPAFILVKNLGMLDSLWALILPWTAGGQVFGIFLLRQFFASMPEELFEAARIDGAGDLRVLYHVALPLAAPILGTLAILQVLGTWNDLIWPSITITTDANQVITVGLWHFRDMHATNWGPLFAGYTIASLPLIILFVFTSRLFVSGLSSGALKL